MAQVRIDPIIKGKIVEMRADGTLIIEAKYTDWDLFIKREYKDVDILLTDGRKLSSNQRKNCYAMIREIDEAMGNFNPEETKLQLKFEFQSGSRWRTADNLFSMSDAPMAFVADFQRFLVDFIVANEVPTKQPMYEYVDDIEAFVYSCTVHKRCCVCGIGPVDLHHCDPIGMGANRDEMIHEGMQVMSLCRKHHSEAHQKGIREFEKEKHLCHGVTADKAICKIYGLKVKA